MELADAVRLLILAYGGAVVGMGLRVLFERAQHYRREGLHDGARSMYALMVTNTLVMSFVAVVLIQRWGDLLSWPSVIALGIFTSKALHFLWLFRLGNQQERRLLGLV